MLSSRTNERERRTQAAPRWRILSRIWRRSSPWLFSARLVWSCNQRSDARAEQRKSRWTNRIVWIRQYFSDLRLQTVQVFFLSTSRRRTVVRCWKSTVLTLRRGHSIVLLFRFDFSDDWNVSHRLVFSFSFCRSALSFFRVDFSSLISDWVKQHRFIDQQENHQSSTVLLFFFARDSLVDVVIARSERRIREKSSPASRKDVSPSSRQRHDERLIVECPVDARIVLRCRDKRVRTIWSAIRRWDFRRNKFKKPA